MDNTENKNPTAAEIFGNKDSQFDGSRKKKGERPYSDDHEHSGKDGYRKVKFQNLKNLFIVDSTPDFDAEEFSVAIHRTSGAAYIRAGQAWVGIGGGGARARMYRGSSQSIPDTTETKISLASNSFTADGVTADTTNHIFTIESDGKYFVNGQITYDSPVADKLYIAIINYNNNQVGYTALHSSITSLLSVRVSVLLDCVAGDEINLAAYHNSGVSKNLNVSNPALCYLEIFKV